MEPSRPPGGLTGMTPPRRLARMGRPARVALVLGAAAISLAACSTSAKTSSSSTTASSTPSAGASSPSTTSTTASSTTTTSTTTTTTAVASGPARCKVSELSATAANPQGAMGSIGQEITLQNMSRSTCTLFGYPGLALLGANGQALPTTVQRGPSVVVQAQAPARVTVAPGHYASFVIGYADATGYGNQVCPTSVNVEVTPPNDFHYLVIPDKVSAYGPKQGQCGAIHISPVYAGNGPQP